MPDFEFDNRRFYFEISDVAESANADRPPLLMLLPRSSGPLGIDPFVNKLASQHRIVRYLEDPAVEEGPANGGLTIEWFAAQTQALLDAIKVDSVHLVCHSTGCGTGQALAASAPDRIASLSLITPWTHADTHLRTMQTLRQAAARSLDPQQYQHFNASILFPPLYRQQQADGFARIAADATADERRVQTFADRLNAILAFDTRPLWRDIQSATLVMCAQDDQLMPCWFAKETAAGIAGAQLHHFDYGGHMLPETRGDDVARVLLAFLAGVEAS